MDRSKLFGTDLKLVPWSGSLDLGRDNAGDLALVSGNENIAQALEMRLRVRKGALAPLGWPNYGSRLHELIGEPINTRTMIKLLAFARSALEQDPRVAKVTDIRADPLPGERSLVRVLAEVQLISQQNPLNLILTVDFEAL